MSPALRTFVDEQRWTLAKTMPKWPHEYIVRERVDEELFERLRRLRPTNPGHRTPPMSSFSGPLWCTATSLSRSGSGSI